MYDWGNIEKLKTETWSSIYGRKTPAKKRRSNQILIVESTIGVVDEDFRNKIPKVIEIAVAIKESRCYADYIESEIKKCNENEYEEIEKISRYEDDE